MRTKDLVERTVVLGAAVAAVAGLVPLWGQTMPATTTAPATTARATAVEDPGPNLDPMFAKIREEGLQRSQAMETLSYLTDVIGPRLTGSPNLKRANQWAMDQMTKFGLSNAHLESWPFNGRGWVVKRFEMQVVTPQQIALIAYPKAWSPGIAQPTVADVVLLEARTEEDLQKYKGKLKGAVVLDGGTRAIGPNFGPEATRLTDKDLERFANARPGTSMDTMPQRTPPTTGPVAGAGPTRGRGVAGGGGLARGRVIAFLMEEGALMELTPTTGTEVGVLVGQAAEVLPTTGRGGAATGAATATAPAAGNGQGGRGGGGGGARGPQGYSANAPESLPQVTVAAEHYNRLVRMAQQGVQMKIDVDMQVEYVNDDLNAYNTIAEIPGSDLKDEVVMLGAHLDSWHMGTGATDNGTGVAECMEAVRIIKALGIQPRRTIRVGLWTGEEEGLLGSRAYVREHFGVTRGDLLGGRGGRGGRGGAAAASDPATQVAGAATGPATAATQAGLLPDHAKFSCYFNTDEGGGRFRGVYASDNAAAADVLRKWLAPVKDLGITVVSPGHATGSDHQAFEGVGLPAFHFMPDPIDYWAGTWHTSQDLYDHVVPEDVRVSSVIMATCVYEAAMADEKMPRRQ